MGLMFFFSPKRDSCYFVHDDLHFLPVHKKGFAALCFSALVSHSSVFYLIDGLGVFPQLFEGRSHGSGVQDTL